jgi:thiol-disulfide isomerase/thioredoxin
MSRRVTVLGKFVEVSKETMRRDGKLVVFFMGAEYCPYCAAERWAVVRALEKFGRRSGLRQTMSAARDEPFLNLPTYDFTEAAYTSPHIEFVAREIEDREFKPLQKLFENEEKLVCQYNSEKQIPFLLIASRFMQTEAGFTPKILIGHTFRQTQTEFKKLKKAESQIRNTIDAEANIIEALLCVAGLPELYKETEVAELVAHANQKISSPRNSGCNLATHTESRFGG